MTIGEKIRQIREDEGLTLAEVAFVANISRQRMSAIENSQTGVPSLPTIQRIAQGLHCSVLDIICEPLEIEHEQCANKSICPFYKKGEKL